MFFLRKRRLILGTSRTYVPMTGDVVFLPWIPAELIYTRKWTGLPLNLALVLLLIASVFTLNYIVLPMWRKE